MGYNSKEKHNKYHREYYYRRKGLTLQEQKLNKVKKLFTKLVEDARKYDIVVESIYCLNIGESLVINSDSIQHNNNNTDDNSLETNYS